MTITSKFPGKCRACGCEFPAGAQIEWSRDGGARHATVQDCGAARTARAQAPLNPPTEDRRPGGPLLNLKAIAEFLRAAQGRGLKRPKLRVLAPDGRSEVRLSLTTSGVAPGSIAVLVADNFVGCIRPNDQLTGALAKDIKLCEHLLEVAKDPARAAKEYAALMGLCSFCNLPLTDAGSVEVGYGPVCAKKWGLPHSPKGTPHLTAAPKAQEPLPLGRRLT